jgi:hypothetical protein
MSNDVRIDDVPSKIFELHWPSRRRHSTFGGKNMSFERQFA